MSKKHTKAILFSWELGGELGHIARLRPLAHALQQRGFKVTFAVRTLQHIDAIPQNFPVVPAPRGTPCSVADAIKEPASYADILFNDGITQPGNLSAMVRAWHSLFDLIKPDLVVHDFSPYTLLALQGKPIRSVSLGTGFACPPNITPLPDLRAWQNHYPERMQITEEQVLQALNKQLDQQNQAPLAHVAELFTRMDANYLATFPELDHYPQRKFTEGSSEAYCGVWSNLGGTPPVWPEGNGPRIFAYLKPFRGLSSLLKHLRELHHPTLVYIAGGAETRHWQSDTLSIVDTPLNMSQVANQCNLAILHAGHGSTASMLLAGKPIVQLPINIEQYHTAYNTEQMGAGVMAKLEDAAGIRRAIDRVIAEPGMLRNAAKFAAQHAAFNPEKKLDEILEQLSRLA